MNKYVLILIVFAFAKANLAQAQQSLIPESNKAYKPPVTTWHGYDVHGPVKQIEIVEYARNKDGIIEPLKLEAFVFHDNGAIDKHLEQNSYFQSAKQYSYTGGILVGHISGSQYGPTEIKYVIDETGKIKSIGNTSFTYDKNGKLYYTFYGNEKSDRYRYDGNITNVLADPSKDTSVYYKDQLITRKEGKRDSFYAYTYPYDGTQLYADEAKLKMTIDVLQRLAVTDIDKYNQTIKAALTDYEKENPLHIFKYNDKGDWIIAVKQPTYDPDNQRYYFRKITYMDGSVSGDFAVDEDYLKKNTKQPKS